DAERQRIAVVVPGDAFEPGVRRRHLLAIGVFGDGGDLAGARVPDIDARLAFEADDLVVGGRDHGDFLAVGGQSELADIAAGVDDLFSALGGEIELPDLPQAVLPVAVLEFAVLGAQAGP